MNTESIGGGGDSLGSQSVIDEAERNGWEVVFPAENQLFLDIDGNEAFAVYEKEVSHVTRYVGIVNTEITPSRSGDPGRRHIVLTLNRPVSSCIERIFLQMFLGSDRTREFLSWARVTRDDPHPTLFIEMKGAPKTT